MSIKGVSENFVWGSNLLNPFEESAPPIFSLTLNMNENGPFYSDDPDLFEVYMILTNMIKTTSNEKKCYCIELDLY